MVKYMYTIKKDYNQETKDILKKLNNEWYNFSRISIHLKNNKIILNDNKKTTLCYQHELTIHELIHANFKSIKSLDLIYD